MSQQYYYLRMNQPVGPVSLDELKRAYTDEVINDATSVCIVGEDSWESLNRQPFYSDVVQVNKLSLKARVPVAPPTPSAPAVGGYDPNKPEVSKPAYDPNKPEISAPAMAQTMTRAPMGQTSAPYNPNMPDPSASNFNPHMSPEEALRQAQEEDIISGPTLATSWKMQLGLGAFALGLIATVASYMMMSSVGGTFFTAYLGLMGFGIFTFYKGYCGE